jgi:hypothetical protein
MPPSHDPTRQGLMLYITIALITTALLLALLLPFIKHMLLIYPQPSESRFQYRGASQVKPGTILNHRHLPHTHSQKHRRHAFLSLYVLAAVFPMSEGKWVSILSL